MSIGMYRIANTVLACVMVFTAMSVEGIAHDALLFAAGLMFGYLINEVITEGETA